MAGLMEGKVGLVTGAASGIGRACALRFAGEGATVLVAHTVRRFGRLDFAHNNAGIGVHQLLHETPDEDFDRVIAVNLRGTFLGMKHQIRQMLDQSRRPNPRPPGARSSTRRPTPGCAR